MGKNGKVMTDLVIEEFIRMYMEGEKIREIALVLDVGKTTLYDYMKTPEFIKRIGQERVTLQNQSRAMLQKDAATYIKNIKEIANKSTDVRSKLKANETLLAYILGQPTAKVETTVNENTNPDSSVLDQLYNESNDDDLNIENEE
jgi:hypothetical protein